MPIVTACVNNNCQNPQFRKLYVLMLEPKVRNGMNDTNVLAKAEVAVQSDGHASDYPAHTVAGLGSASPNP